MNTVDIDRLLQPFAKLDQQRLILTSMYIDLLLKWNARMNLTAIREPNDIVQRHFGESLFAAKYLLAQHRPQTAIDVGSGAGFPGVPFAMLAPDVQVTLIESQHKKATFLKELVRVLELKNVKVFGDRAETYRESADLVMLRAVEKFQDAQKIAVRLTSPAGKVGLMIGSGQVELATKLSAEISWGGAVEIPCSNSRVLLWGSRL